MGENENRKWHCPEGDKLWADLDTDAERIEFLESGQAINTGIIAPSMIAEIVSVFRRVETAEADLAEARAVIEKLEVRVDEPCDDCAITERDEARAVIERVREVSRNFDCTNPEKSKHELCRALLPAPATEEGREK
jgi:hypothetical protein